uniref:Uncharacterized protein n=1 Tax=Capra hircus TaxID=9925 RepID=A0A8C2SLY6_CAPHI
VREAPPTGGTPQNGRGPGAGPGLAVELPVPSRGGRLRGSVACAWLRLGALGPRGCRQAVLFCRVNCKGNCIFCTFQVCL